MEHLTFLARWFVEKEFPVFGRSGTRKLFRHMFSAPFSQVKLRSYTGLPLILLWHIPICSWKAVEWQTLHNEYNYSKVYLCNYYNYNFEVYLCILTCCKQYQCRLLYIYRLELTGILALSTSSCVKLLCSVSALYQISYKQIYIYNELKQCWARLWKQINILEKCIKSK